MECEIDGCSAVILARKMCERHYARWRRTGTAAPDKPFGGNLPALERFNARVDKSRGSAACWPWIGGRTSEGYGRLWVGGREWMAHRYAYTLTRGPIPDEMDVLHSCDNPPCCNDAHFFLGTNIDNIADRHAKGRDARGSQNGESKLTEGDVITVRIRYAAGGVSQQALGQEFGVSQVMIGNIVRRRSWAHLSE